MTTQPVQTTVAAPSGREALLHRTLVGNTIFSEVTGLALMFGAGAVGGVIGITVLRPLVALGLVLVLFGAEVYATSRRPTLNRREVISIIALDAGWVVASAVLLVGGWLSLSGAGTWAVLLVADAVATFGLLQYLGLRRAQLVGAALARHPWSGRRSRPLLSCSRLYSSVNPTFTVTW